LNSVTFEAFDIPKHQMKQLLKMQRMGVSEVQSEIENSGSKTFSEVSRIESELSEAMQIDIKDFKFFDEKNVAEGFVMID
jgi:hypothetical protein